MLFSKNRHIRVPQPSLPKNHAEPARQGSARQGRRSRKRTRPCAPQAQGVVGFQDGCGTFTDVPAKTHRSRAGQHGRERTRRRTRAQPAAWTASGGCRIAAAARRRGFPRCPAARAWATGGFRLAGHKPGPAAGQDAQRPDPAGGGRGNVRAFDRPRRPTVISAPAS